MRVPRVITDTVPISPNLVWVNQRTVQVAAKPQYMVSDQDDRIAGCGARVRRGTLCNRNVGRWLVFCRKGRYSTIFAGKFHKSPVRASTRGVSVVIDFIVGNVPRGGFRGVNWL